MGALSATPFTVSYLAFSSQFEDVHVVSMLLSALKTGIDKSQTSGDA